MYIKKYIEIQDIQKRLKKLSEYITFLILKPKYRNSDAKKIMNLFYKFEGNRLKKIIQYYY